MRDGTFDVVFRHSQRRGHAVDGVTVAGKCQIVIGSVAETFRAGPRTPMSSSMSASLTVAMSVTVSVLIGESRWLRLSGADIEYLSRRGGCRRRSGPRT
jgi:hypothetical protein